MLECAANSTVDCAMISFPLSRTFALGFCLMLLSGCATGSLLPVSPKVRVESVQLGQFNLQNQQFVFNLAVENRNRFAIPVLSTDFSVKFAGNQLASGQNSDKISLVASGTTLVPIRVDMRLYESITEFLAALARGKLDLDYQLDGTFKVSAVSFPVDIPFSLHGSVLSQFTR